MIPKSTWRSSWWRTRCTAGSDPLVVTAAVVDITASIAAAAVVVVVVVVAVAVDARAVVIRGIFHAHPARSSRSESRN